MEDHHALRTRPLGQSQSFASTRLLARPVAQARTAREECRAREGARVSLKMPMSKREAR